MKFSLESQCRSRSPGVLVVHQRGGAAHAGLELGHTPRKLLAVQLYSLKWSNFHATAISRSVRICVDQEILINRWWWAGSGRSLPLEIRTTPWPWPRVRHWEIFLRIESTDEGSRNSMNSAGLPCGCCPCWFGNRVCSARCSTQLSASLYCTAEFENLSLETKRI